MSEDPEIAKIMQRKMEEMLKPKPEPTLEPGIIDLNDSNFDAGAFDQLISLPEMLKPNRIIEELKDLIDRL